MEEVGKVRRRWIASFDSRRDGWLHGRRRPPASQSYPVRSLRRRFGEASYYPRDHAPPRRWIKRKHCFRDRGHRADFRIRIVGHSSTNSFAVFIVYCGKVVMSSAGSLHDRRLRSTKHLGQIDDMKNIFTARVTQDGKWFVAQCLEVDVASQGRSESSALRNLREALELHFQPPVPTRRPKLHQLRVGREAA